MDVGRTTPAAGRVSSVPRTGQISACSSGGTCWRSPGRSSTSWLVQLNGLAVDGCGRVVVRVCRRYVTAERLGAPRLLVPASDGDTFVVWDGPSPPPRCRR